MSGLPILYSFRRCPYAMRARLAIASAEFRVELREVLLRDKPGELIGASPKGTVPVLLLPDGRVLEESRDIMEHVLAASDREGLLDFSAADLAEMSELIDRLDGPFKAALDRYKYPDRYEGTNRFDARGIAAAFAAELDERLRSRPYLFGDRVSFADLACWPFIRQFAHVDRDWFWSKDWPGLIAWLDAFIASDRLKRIFAKYPRWESGEAGVQFPPPARD
jgi:glutathione S-transferase